MPNKHAIHASTKGVTKITLHDATGTVIISTHTAPVADITSVGARFIIRREGQALMVAFRKEGPAGLIGRVTITVVVPAGLTVELTGKRGSVQADDKVTIIRAVN